MKFTGILNETGPTLNENAFYSFVVAKQIFLWQLPQLHRCNWQLLVYQIRNGIIGEQQVSLKKFTTDCNERYRWGTISSGTTEQGYLVHNALLVS